MKPMLKKTAFDKVARDSYAINPASQKVNRTNKVYELCKNNLPRVKRLVLIPHGKQWA